MTKTTKFVLLVLTLQLVFDAQAEAPIIQPGAPGEDSKKLDPEAASNIAGASYVQADVDFLTGMIVHHEQAILMSSYAKKRTNNKKILDLANRIDASILLARSKIFLLLVLFLA